ncbi:hypothetical protein [Lewinella cohaerens]|uniref:hypothetical protein n=1 Tax=Lewinella cohaerens TaxID=70995 RepID=UPI00037D2235|nr:hypothetical protein [Lewinella cohaerens]
MKTLQKSKLARQLSRLNTKNQQQFLLFVSSPYFNTHQLTADLATYLLGPPCCNWGTTTKQDISRALFRDKVYNESKINALMTKLMALLRRFVLHHQLEESPLAKELTLKNMLGYSMHDWFAQEYQKISETQAERQQKINEQQIHWLDDLEREIPSELLLENIQLTTQTYFKNSLEYACTLVQIAQTTQTTIDTKVVIRIHDQLTNQWPELLKIPVIKLYYYNLKVIWGQEREAAYQQLKQVFYDHTDQWEERDLFNAYRSIINFCVRKTNTGDKYFQRETLRIYQFIIQKKHILKNGQIKQVTYNNVISLACLEKEFAWAKEFAEDFKRFLAPEVQKNAYFFNSMNILYHEKDYSSSLGIMQKVNFTSVQYQAKTKIIQLKIYYELAEWMLLDAALNSFRLFLLRTKKSGLHSDQLLVFIRFLRQLAKIRERKAIVSDTKYLRLLVALKDKITASSKTTFDQRWLMLKINEQGAFLGTI